jgi:phage terminase Nu1 subunit (DNA packaging protein)
MPVVPEAFREEYRQLVAAHIDALSRSFAGVRVDYAMLDTSKPLDHALYRYLAGRQKAMKGR